MYTRAITVGTSVFQIQVNHVQRSWSQGQKCGCYPKASLDSLRTKPNLNFFLLFQCQNANFKCENNCIHIVNQHVGQVNEKGRFPGQPAR